MRIAFSAVKNIVRGGGIEKYTSELGSRLVQRGHEVTVYATRHYGDVPDRYLGMRIIAVPSFARASMEKLSCSAAAAVDSSWKKKYDIVHFHSFAPGAFAWLPRLRGCKCVLQLHSLEWQRSRWGTVGSCVVRILEKLALAQSHAYTAVSKTQCAFYRARRGIEMEYIPTAAEVKPVPEARRIYELGLEPGRYVLFAARLVPEKGAHYLISAFRRLKTDMKLVIAGDIHGADVYKRELRDLARGDARILLPGFVEGRLLDELFGHCYLYVQPSEVEGLSLSILEAMSYGRCCLVSDIPENLEAVADMGFAFGNKNVDELEDRLRWLLEHPEAVTAVSLGAKERVRKNYSWQFITDRIEQFYFRLLTR
jgi:glycosyltransferase involved in cell wall biosynthesis